VSENTSAIKPEIVPKKKAVSRSEMSKLQWTWKEMKRNKTAYFMIAPFYIIFLSFTIIPVIVSMFLSFTSFNMLEAPVFIGMDNYTRLFLNDDIFIKACENTLIFAAITGPVSYLLSFIVAWFINELPPKVRAFVTLIFYAPSISGGIYMIWKVLFSSDAYGYANGILLAGHLRTYSVVRKPEICYAIVHSSCAVDIARCHIPVLYRRTSDR